MATVWSVVSLVGARAGQMYSKIQHARSVVMQNMTNVLYDKLDDAQEGVLSMLLVCVVVSVCLLVCVCVRTCECVYV